jgi:hypothetical protein
MPALTMLSHLLPEVGRIEGYAVKQESRDDLGAT